MTELAERIAIGVLGRELDNDCPFKDVPDGVDDTEDENIQDDDASGVRGQQSNDGGVLGKNLIAASPGKSGTVGGPFAPPEAREDPRIDTTRTRLMLKVPGTADVETDHYGFTVAAHHLIPGEAALAPSELTPFMTKDKQVEITLITPKGKKVKKKTIEKHIGYNVNGCHNGVWLPGNYYIRKTTSPIRNKSWSELGDNDWCLHYVAAAVKVAGGQFHDAHTQYSAAVKELLNKIALIVSKHECDDCEKPKINPPFVIKSRLYRLSAHFKTKLASSPGAWKLPWFASDRWADDAFTGSKPSKAFMKAYIAATSYQYKPKAKKK
jgi:hypothetical protein